MAPVHGGAQASAELFDKDGFYMTGDIVQQETATRVVWIDRKKNVLKLSQGEFVSLGRLEAVYKGGSNLIHQACMAVAVTAHTCSVLLDLKQPSAVCPVLGVRDSIRQCSDAAPLCAADFPVRQLPALVHPGSRGAVPGCAPPSHLRVDDHIAQLLI